MSPSQQHVEEMLLSRRLTALRAADAAEAVYQELTICLAAVRPPDLSSQVVAQARQAEPFGDFPDHRVLMMAFEDLL